MSTTRGNNNLPVIDAQSSTKLKALLRRWRQAYLDARDALTESRDSQRPTDGQLSQAPDAMSDPQLIGSGPPATDADSAERPLVPLPDERAQALAVLCDRLLQELDGEDVRAAEIRFVVHRHEHPGYPRLDPEAVADPATGELLWELRRLIAWSGGAIADVARVLETRGSDLDKEARALLQDEIAALDVDLATLNVHLADPVDWDTEFHCLLAGEVAPFDDPVADEDDDNDD